jgi:DNA mismatch endonuclease (patch repair protein)
VADIVDAATRSRMMSGIRGKHTKPEMLVRQALHRRGFRYRLHSSKAPGRPDLVFTSLNAVVFVNGCFWHGHNCRFFKIPSTRREFWIDKIDRNRHRDALVCSEVQKTGWRQLVVWECALRGKDRVSQEKVANRIARWLLSKSKNLQIRGP